MMHSRPLLTADVTDLPLACRTGHLWASAFFVKSTITELASLELFIVYNHTHAFAGSLMVQSEAVSAVQTGTGWARLTGRVDWAIAVGELAGSEDCLRKAVFLHESCCLLLFPFAFSLLAEPLKNRLTIFYDSSLAGRDKTSWNFSFLHAR